MTPIEKGPDRAPRAPREGAERRPEAPPEAVDPLRETERDLRGEREELSREVETGRADKPLSLPKTPQEALTTLTDTGAKLGGKLSAGFGKGLEAITKIVDSFSGGTMLFFASLLENADSPWLKGIANWLRGRAEPGAIREAMEKKLKAKVEKTPEDAGHAKTLRAQYEAKLDADKKDPKTYGFETFYTQKLAELAARAPKETYTLADLAELPSAEQAKVEEETKTKAEEETKKRETEKTLVENPERAYIETFRDALNAVRPNAVPVVEGEPLPQIVEKIIASFSSTGNVGHNNYGMEIDGQTLNESDGGNYWYSGTDWNILHLWEDKLRSNPLGAIQDFLAVDPAKWESTNMTAATTMKKIRDYMDKHGITPVSLTSGKAPENAATPKKTPAADAGTDVEFSGPMM